MKRALTTSALALGLVATNASGSNGPAAENATKFLAAPAAALQLHPSLSSIASAKATDLSNGKATYFVEVNNPAPNPVSLTLHLGAVSVPVNINAKSKTGVSITETSNDLNYVCGIPGRKVHLALSGAGADPNEKVFEWTGAPQWTSNAYAGTLGGTAPVPGGPPAVWAQAPVTINTPYGCGQRPQLTFSVSNGLAKEVTGLRFEVLDGDGTTILADLPVGPLGPHSVKSSWIVTKTTVAGYIGGGLGGRIKVKLLDPQHELTPEQNPSAVYLQYNWSAGILNLKASS